MGGGWSFDNLNGVFTVSDPAGRAAVNKPVLKTMQALKQFIEGFDFLKMRPDRSFVLSGIPEGAYCRGMSQRGAICPVSSPQRAQTIRVQSDAGTISGAPHFRSARRLLPARLGGSVNRSAAHHRNIHTPRRDASGLHAQARRRCRATDDAAARGGSLRPLHTIFSPAELLDEEAH